MKFEAESERAFLNYGPYWHLCTPGNLQSIIFRDNDDYVYGMNLIAFVAGMFTEDIKIFTFQIMSNHLHFVLSGHCCPVKAPDDYYKV